MQIGVEISKAIENKRVFVVHKDEIIRAALQFMLHDENEAHENTCLDEAYHKANCRPVDLVLLDIAIVQENGADVIQQVAARLPGTKVLLVTETADDPLAIRLLESGAHGVLAKPLRIETVRRKVDGLLGRYAKVALKVL